MDNEERVPPEMSFVVHMSFVIHLWLDPGPRWRGRVSDGGDNHAFEDTDSLLAFIQERLQRASAARIALPTRRAQA
jgi:hypothetical protein